MAYSYVIVVILISPCRFFPTSMLY